MVPLLPFSLNLPILLFQLPSPLILLFTPFPSPIPSHCTSPSRYLLVKTNGEGEGGGGVGASMFKWYTYIVYREGAGKGDREGVITNLNDAITDSFATLNSEVEGEAKWGEEGERGEGKERGEEEGKWDNRTSLPFCVTMRR